MEFYQKRKAAHLLELKKLTTRYNIISASRLFIAIAFLILGYFSLKAEKPAILLCCMAFCVVEFVLLMKRHVLVHNKKLRAEALVKINQEETDYLSNTNIPFGDGVIFTDFTHSYSYDLDIFGPRSLFHNINRTQTYKGSEKLADLLTRALPPDEILRNQEAIKELAAKPEFRQEIMALGIIKKDSKSVYNRLVDWASKNTGEISGFANILAYIFPAIFFGCIIAYVVTKNSTLANIIGLLFFINLIFISFYLKYIKAEIKDSAGIDEIINNYGLIIEQVEKESFESDKLNALQKSLAGNNKHASKQIKKLAELFSKLDSINNVFGALLFNGALLFHFHTLKALWKWKNDHAEDIIFWLDIIAEIEALSSFGNLYYNNPDFTFPELNSTNKIEFRNLTHPLLKKENRIGNDINFDTGFTILTGSNMSGKSTFLRSLGVNMVLAGAGAPVCAAQANIHPLPVLVSMRQSDSLADSESYFFAEVKRLKYIMDELTGKQAFVLLDEILKGTNSDDKHTGTIKVIKKMISLTAIGAIATHDIEVCSLADEYPHKLINRCFEARIENNELLFDYRLRDGICRNKSATFLMEKLGIV